jgi:cytochrome c-type biogenesis protein
MEGLSVPTTLAFIAGLIAFASPHGLALVPGYLAIVSGLSLDQVHGGSKASLLRLPAIRLAIMFLIGFSLTFIALGSSVAAPAVLSSVPLLVPASGVVLIAFGLHLVGVIRINLQRRRALPAALLFGAAFALGWSPDIGPILASILSSASNPDTMTKGIFLLAFYSLGVAAPLLLLSFGIHRTLLSDSYLKEFSRAMKIACGMLVLALGVLIVTGQMSQVHGYFQISSPLDYHSEEALLRTMS